MKIRNGFVSTSSSSSFLIYGIYLDNSKISERLKLEEEDSTMDALDKLIFEGELQGLTAECPPYESGKYIGKSWDEIKDDQTGKQFKEEVEQKLKKVFGEDIECLTHSEAWHDG